MCPPQRQVPRTAPVSPSRRSPGSIDGRRRTSARRSNQRHQALRVPYYFVPRALSDIKTKLGSKLKPSNPTTTANITNEDGVIAGDADFYAWGLSDGKEAGKASNDVRAIGVQSFPFNATNAVHRLLGEHVRPLVERIDERVRHLRRCEQRRHRRLRRRGCRPGGGPDRHIQRPDGLVRLQHQKRRREHRLLRAGADGQRDGEHLRPLEPALPCRRAVPERGEPALQVRGGLVRSERGRSA